jgi:predicted RNA-binding Zn-ribbon protein involved in translation (DUF1610 family)
MVYIEADMASIYREPPDTPRVSVKAALSGAPLDQAHDPVPYETVDHAALFASAHSTPLSQCHACERELHAADDEGFSVPGKGLLIWARGDERRAEEPKLCPSCGAAIGMTMLTRWAIEEEEG